jgi:hypothetical protein
MRYTLPAVTASLVLFVALATPVPALPSADDLKASIDERAMDIIKYRVLLESNDQATRLAALDALLASDDLALRAFAYETAFASKDRSMRAIALKRKIGEMKTLVIDVEAGKTATDKEKKVMTAWGGTYAFELQSFDAKTGTFKTSDYDHNGEGQVTGTTLSFSHRFCNGTFSLGDGAVLTGTLGCKGKWEGRFTGKISLY